MKISSHVERIAYEATTAALPVLDKYTHSKSCKSSGSCADTLAAKVHKAIAMALVEYFGESDQCPA